MIKTSPLAPTLFPSLPPIPGVRLAAGNCGIRYKDRPDLLLVILDEGTQAAGVLTRSLASSAPVDACKASLIYGTGRALLVNAGNSNAFTGKLGIESVERCVRAAAQRAGCAEHDVYMASTGVIGVPLPDQRITDMLPALFDTLDGHDWKGAAQAICTTDTFIKMVTRTARIGDAIVTINGIAKGSGMIAPDMATMLAFLFTDAAIPAPTLQQLLTDANEVSFNRTTVDGDTSTSDTCLLFATGKTGAAMPRISDYTDFQRALIEAMTELAQLVVRDGEGASKFITISVIGAEHDAAAKRIGLSIANSPLVKTAIAGADANWGRIVMAVGKAGERAERDKLRIDIGGVCVARDGMADPNYQESQIEKHMKGEYIEIAVDVGVGKGLATIWTCDLTHGYIDINGSYRT